MLKYINLISWPILILLIYFAEKCDFKNPWSSTQCWTCSSNHEVKCADPFGPGGDNMHLKRYKILDLTADRRTHPVCQIPISSVKLQNRLYKCEVGVHHSFPNLIPPVAGCMKLKKRLVPNGTVITIRNCTWKHPGDHSNHCPGLRLMADETEVFCQTCLYDGCNGVAPVCETIALMLASMALLVFK